MPGKHVHFASDAFSTPSPSFTASSLPSSAGPMTPPPVAYYGSPYASKPLPSACYKIHPILAVVASPHLVYDVSHPPASLQPRLSSTPRHVLSEFATEPPLPYLEVISPLLPWRIIIASRDKQRPFVTVADVLESIYASLRLPISGAEFSLIPSSETRARITEAYRRRCKRQPSPKEVATETAKGVKRVDFLMGHNVFLGVSSTKEGGHVWQLNVS